MSALTLTPTRFCQGVWHGILEHAGTDEPQVAVTHLSSKIPDVQVTKVDNQWSIKVPIPIETIGDGVQVFIITDENNDKKIFYLKETPDMAVLISENFEKVILVNQDENYILER